MGSNIKRQINILDSISKINPTKNVSTREKIGQIPGPQERPNRNEVSFSVGLNRPKSRILNLVKNIIPEN
jgi:hypothetical protein